MSSYLNLTPHPPVADRPNNHAQIMSVQATMTAIALAVVGLRIWVRRVVLSTIGWDDGFILLAMCFSLVSLTCFVGLIMNGGGCHWWDIGVPTEYEGLLFWAYVHIIINVTGVSIVKISVCLALLRFIRGKWYQMFLKFLLAFIIVFTLGTEAPLIFQCWPVYHIWSLTPPPPGVCIPWQPFITVANVNGITNTITDAILVLIPIPTIICLKVNTRTKASVIGVLLIGFVAAAAAIIRVIVSNENPQLTDGSWTLKYYVWNSIELNLGIIASSLPPLRPLFSNWLESTITSRFRTGSSGQSATATGDRSFNSSAQPRFSKHGYQRQREESYVLSESREWHGGRKASQDKLTKSASRTTIIYGQQENSREEILRMDASPAMPAKVAL